MTKTKEQMSFYVFVYDCQRMLMMFNGIIIKFIFIISLYSNYLILCLLSCSLLFRPPYLYFVNRNQYFMTSSISLPVAFWDILFFRTASAKKQKQY